MLALRPSPRTLSSPSSTAARPAQNCSNIRLLAIFEHQAGPPYKARSKTGSFSNTSAASDVFDGGARIEKITYPNGRVLFRDYGTADGADDRLNRAANLYEASTGGTKHVAYSYNGAVSDSVNSAQFVADRAAPMSLRFSGGIVTFRLNLDAADRRVSVYRPLKLPGGDSSRFDGIRMSNLKNKTLFITGASRGIGRAIALRAARDGANVAVVAKTAEPHPKLPGTVYSAVEEIEAAGGRGLACVADIRFDGQVQEAVQRTVETFGGIDILVNNASAIHLTSTIETPMKRFDLMHSVNVRGTFLCSQLCLPHLAQADNPHILNLAPPLNMDPQWFAGHLAYTMAKYGMSMCVLGMAEEFRDQGIAVNALWPRTVIATAAIRNLLGGDAVIQMSRTPEIVADAAYAILTRESRTCTGNFFTDEEALAAAGVTDLSRYAVAPDGELQPDFFL